MGQAKVTLWVDILFSPGYDAAMALLRGGGENGRRQPPSPRWKPGSIPSFSFSIFSRSFSISLLETLSRRSSSISAIPSSKSSSTGLGPRIQSVEDKKKTWEWNLIKGLSVTSKGALEEQLLHKVQFIRYGEDSVCEKSYISFFCDSGDSSLKFKKITQMISCYWRYIIWNVGSSVFGTKSQDILASWFCGSAEKSPEYPFKMLL